MKTINKITKYLFYLMLFLIYAERYFLKLGSVKNLSHIASVQPTISSATLSEGESVFTP